MFSFCIINIRAAVRVIVELYNHFYVFRIVVLALITITYIESLYRIRLGTAEH